MTIDADRNVAACLTAAVPGGVAVIQVVGPSVARKLAPLLRARRPLDLQKLPDEEIRLCRLIDGEEILDDVLVAARDGRRGGRVIDLNLHGGPRVVQRALMLLGRSGIEIVAADEMTPWVSRAESLIESEILQLLPQAATVQIAQWLCRLRRTWPSEIERLRKLIHQNNRAEALARLQTWIERAPLSCFLLNGIRVVLVGPPNSGKSTLANALARRRQGIISERAGTTRDWVEHPASAEGVPITVVDTAGLRDTDDPIEREAVARARKQLSDADVILHVRDVTAQSSADQITDDIPTVPTPRLVVWNKIDLNPVSYKEAEAASVVSGVRVSALGGEGLGGLRQKILAAVGLADWETDWVLPLNERQRDACARLLSELHGECPQGEIIHIELHRLLHGEE